MIARFRPRRMRAGRGTLDAMSPTSIDTLIRINDPCLEDLLRARGEEVETAIEQLMLDAQPLIAEIVARYTNNAVTFPLRDGEDVRNTANLRLLAKLRAIARSDEEAVYDFRKYVATITYNAVNDYFRRSFPDRARLKSRLRHVCTHDPRLALWPLNGTLVAGLAEWSGSHGMAGELSEDIDVRDEKDRPAEALMEIFARTERPVAFDPLIEYLAAHWNVNDLRESSTDIGLAGGIADTVADYDTRDYLAALWREIRDLRPMQRKALLLNLRSGSTVNVLALLVLTGTAVYEDVAAALEMPADELTALWRELPLDDLRIASQLQVTRQQVINLRKSAREKLNRRMAGRGSGRK
jgi:RNA polymerase sigma factor (sigma-70 family)